MSKIKSFTDLQKFRDELRSDKKKAEEKEIIIKVAMATCSIASGAKDLLQFIIEELDKRNIDAKVVVTGCMSYCYAEPTIEIKLPGYNAVVFGYVDKKKADEIIESYIKNKDLPEGIIPVNYQIVE